MTKRLYRSQNDRMIWGVCGGLANYFDIDPTVVRLITVLLVFLGGFVILAYILFAVIVPLEPSKAPATGEAAEKNTGSAPKSEDRELSLSLIHI